MDSNENAEISDGSVDPEVEDILKSARPPDNHKDSCSNGRKGKLCSSPCMLSCFLCPHCLDESFSVKAFDSLVEALQVPLNPQCQEKKEPVKSNEAVSLPHDCEATKKVLTTIRLRARISKSQDDVLVKCGSCITNNPAMSICFDCSEYLCVNCKSAHETLRLFKDHHVADVMILDDKSLNKPIFCTVHSTNELKLFCTTCEIPLCTECIMHEHSEHVTVCKALADVLPPKREELQKFLETAIAKLTVYCEVSTSVENALSELKTQHENAKVLIEETYESYKAVLEKCRDNTLLQVDQLRSDREMIIKDFSEKLERSRRPLNESIFLVDKLLNLGNAVEIVSLKKRVLTVLYKIVNFTPKPVGNFHLNFRSKMADFEEAAKETFGLVSTSEKPAEAEGNEETSSGSDVESGSILVTCGSSGEDVRDDDGCEEGSDVSDSKHVRRINLGSAVRSAGLAKLPKYKYNLESSPSVEQLCYGTEDQTGRDAGLNSQGLAVRFEKTLGLSNPFDEIETGEIAESSDDEPDLVLSKRRPNHKGNPKNLLKVISKFGSLGSKEGELNNPNDFCVCWNDHIAVADSKNHRVQVFDKNGNFKFMFGGAKKKNGSLYFPTKIAAMEKAGKFVVCDRGYSRGSGMRLQIFSYTGQFVDIVPIKPAITNIAGLTVTSNGSIIAVVSDGPTIIAFSENGRLILRFDCSEHVKEPSDIAFFGNEFYVCDLRGNAVVTFGTDGRFKRKIDPKYKKDWYPSGISVSNTGQILVGNAYCNHFFVTEFNPQGEKTSEYICPVVKVSRCCGLKLNSQGLVMTLAKFENYVLALERMPAVA